MFTRFLTVTILALTLVGCGSDDPAPVAKKTPPKKEVPKETPPKKEIPKTEVPKKEVPKVIPFKADYLQAKSEFEKTISQLETDEAEKIAELKQLQATIESDFRYTLGVLPKCVESVKSADGEGKGLGTSCARFVRYIFAVSVLLDSQPILLKNNVARTAVNIGNSSGGYFLCLPWRSTRSQKDSEVEPYLTSVLTAIGDVPESYSSLKAQVMGAMATLKDNNKPKFFSLEFADVLDYSETYNSGKSNNCGEFFADMQDTLDRNALAQALSSEEKGEITDFETLYQHYNSEFDLDYEIAKLKAMKDVGVKSRNYGKNY